MADSQINLIFSFSNIEWLSHWVLGLFEGHINADYIHGKKFRYRKEMMSLVLKIIF